MTFTVITEAAAEREWNEAVDWYEVQEPGVGERLNLDIRAVLHAIAEDPGRFPMASRLARKARVFGWPYSIYFAVNTEYSEVKVIAVWHGRRDPAVLRRRLEIK